MCKHWLQATQIAKILNKYKLSFNFVSIDLNEEPLTLFANSERVFSNIYFENVKFVSIDRTFWSYWSDHITEVSFNYMFRTPDLPDGNFVKLLKYTPRLKTLNLICSSVLFNSYFDKLPLEDKSIVLKIIENLKQLQMYFCRHCLSSSEFGTWDNRMTNLKNVHFYSEKSPTPNHALNEIFVFRFYSDK